MDLQQTRDAVIQHFREIRTQFLDAIEGLTETQLTEPSIDGWSVEDHLNHLAFWHDLRCSEIIRISAGFEHAWPLSVDSQALNDIVQPARANLSLDQARWEYESSVDRIIEAVGRANERGLTQSHYGEVGLGTTHDLAHAEFIRNWRQAQGI
ncbi:MAG: maleylpyruvate isomerase N-terminal domain-containing protein [Actinobacteria bacterium]|nr:maleylpyruvate isomerase N-terminal domain-containing protein [Actinomycetota bacterium]